MCALAAKRGIRNAERLGGGSNVGHCADQFGHIAQMPQLMAQLGLTSACLWRGVPDAVPGWSFQWEAPDGTRLPVLYLRHSYSSGWRLPEERDDLLERVRREERDRRPDEPALLMNGTDHSRMEKHVPAALAAAAGQGYDFQLATLGEYAAAQLAAGIDDFVLRGELRSPDNSNVLVGVLSARMNIKQRDFEVASLLERVAEPLELLAHLHGGTDKMPALKRASRLALENSPHDSICGCSVDETHREMFPRYDRAEQLARAVAGESLAELARMTATAGPALAVFRPVPFAPVVVHATVPAEWDAHSLVLPDGSRVPCVLGEATPEVVLQHDQTSPNGARTHLNFLRDGRYDADSIESMTATVSDRRLVVETRVGGAANAVDDVAVRREVRRIAREGLADTAEMRVVRSGTRRLTAVLPAGATIGVEILRPSPERVLGEELRAVGRAIESDLLRVEAGERALKVTDMRTGLVVRGVNTFLSEGDRGDEYNADIVGRAVQNGRLREVAVRTDAVSATLTYRTTLDLPAGLAADRERRSEARTAVEVACEVRLWAGIPRVDFRTTVENTARDHRLRVLVPLPWAVSEGSTEGPFHVANRPLAAEKWNGRSAEKPPTTFPQKTFSAFQANREGVAIMNRGLPEGEVVRLGAGQSYALTLLRCVGWLSRNDLRSRRGGAGPMIETPEAQMLGRHAFEYALTTYAGDWRGAGVQPLAHAFAHQPLAVTTNAHQGRLGPAMRLATFAQAGVVPSALCRSEVDGAPLVRVYSSAPSPIAVGVELPALAGEPARTDLLERPLAGSGDPLTLRPWEIATLRF